MQDRFYCIHCKKTFPDLMETRRRQKTISWGQFMANQQQVIWYGQVGKQNCNKAGEVVALKLFTGNKRHFEVSCPFCWSINTVNATEIMEEIIKTKQSQKRNKKGRFIKENKCQALKIYPKWLRNAIEKAYRKSVPLNTMNNIIRCGDS